MKALRLLLHLFGINYLYNLFSRERIVAIGYHSISNSLNNEKLSGELYKHLSVDSNTFKKHLNILKKLDYSFLRFSDLEIMKRDGSLPKKVALIYFDDGLKDNFINVYPILKAEGVPATLFPVVNFINKKITYQRIEDDAGLTDIFLSWRDIVNMKDIFEVGTHTMNHKKLDQLSENDIKYELSESKKTIESEIGESVTTLSYPKSRFNAYVQKHARELGFKSTIANGRGINKESDLFLLKKIPTNPNDSIIDFKVRLGIWYPLVNFFKS